MTTDPQKVVFLFGGPGTEHAVSCATAKSALPAFGPEFVLLPVFITKDQQWVCADSFVTTKDAWLVAEVLQTQSGIPHAVALDALVDREPDTFFIGLHGEFGEDGTLQALLEARGLAFTGSRSEASALAMDKPRVLQLLQDEDIAVPEFLEIDQATKLEDVVAFPAYYGYPCVVLPATGGSSVGVTIVQSAKEMTAALDRARQVSPRVLITRYIKGVEVTCGLLVTSPTDLETLPPTEIIPIKGHDFFDYEAKYEAGECQELTPPQHITVAAFDAVQATAKRVHQLIGADGYSRVDMIVDEDGTPYVLEINTLPGLTATSLLPQAALVAGYTLTDLLAVLCTNIDRTGLDYVSFSLAELSEEDVQKDE